MNFWAIIHFLLYFNYANSLSLYCSHILIFTHMMLFCNQKLRDIQSNISLPVVAATTYHISLETNTKLLIWKYNIKQIRCKSCFIMNKYDAICIYSLSLLIKYIRSYSTFLLRWISPRHYLPVNDCEFFSGKQDKKFRASVWLWKISNAPGKLIQIINFCKNPGNIKWNL